MLSLEALASGVESAERISVTEDDGSEWAGIVLPVEIRADLVYLLRGAPSVAPVYVRPLSVTPKQAADLTGLAEGNIRNAIHTLALPAKRRGSLILIPLAGLERWLEGLPAAFE